MIHDIQTHLKAPVPRHQQIVVEAAQAKLHEALDMGDARPISFIFDYFSFIFGFGKLS